MSSHGSNTNPNHVYIKTYVWWTFLRAVFHSRGGSIALEYQIRAKGPLTTICSLIISSQMCEQTDVGAHQRTEVCLEV